MAEILQVTTTCPSRDVATRIGRTLVEERLAACAQISGPVASLYRWEGRLEEAEEWYCILKTAAARYPELERRLRSLHPYDVPEILAVPAARGLPGYLEWVAGETGPS